MRSGVRARPFCASICSLAARTCSRMRSLDVLNFGEGCEGEAVRGEAAAMADCVIDKKE